MENSRLQYLKMYCFISLRNIHTDMDIFNMIYNLDSKTVFHVCTDGAKAMNGHTKQLLVLVKEIAPEYMFTHCCLHHVKLQISS